jgi:hypothetical protein
MFYAVIVILLLATAIAVPMLVRSRRAPEHQAAVKARSQARHDVTEATRRREAALKPLRQNLDRATRDHDKAIAAAKKELDALRDPKGKRLGAYGGITLYERWIDTPHGSGSVAGVTASVDSQLSSRFTATRIVALGVFALAAKKKTGNLYLMIDGPQIASIVDCPKDQDRRAREFAVKVMNAGKQAEGIIAGLPERMKSAEQTLQARQNDTGTVDAAHAELKAAEANPALLEPIAAAEARLAEAEERLAAIKGTTRQGSS